MTSKEKVPPQTVNHYANKFWNDLPEVRAYMSENATGNPNQWWTPYFKNRYAQKPFNNALILGCGNGRIEREMFDLEIANSFHAFDCSDEYLEEAKRQKGDRSISYEKSTFREFIPKMEYDLVVNVASLHHVEDIDLLMQKISNCLPPQGIFVNWDYVGPNRMQYHDEQLNLMTTTNNSLPIRFRQKRPLRGKIGGHLKGDATEGIRSFDIIKYFNRYFETIERHDLGGGIAYEILLGNIDEFLKDDSEAKKYLAWLIEQDRHYTVNRIIPTSFSFFIGRTSTPSQNLYKKTKRFYMERLEQQLVEEIDHKGTLPKAEGTQDSSVTPMQEKTASPLFLQKLAKLIRKK